MPRLLKQIVIALIFFSAVGSIAYFSLVKDEPALSPLPVQSFSPLLVISQKLLKVGDKDYDFLAEIKNPNSDFGAAEVFYELNLFDPGGGLEDSKKGKLALLPQETRFEIVSPVRTESEISRTEFKITSAVFEKLKEYIPQNIFSARNEEYSLLPSNQGFSRLKAAIINNSNFDFDRADVLVILFGEGDSVIAVNKTDIRTFLAGETRDIEIKWFSPFDGQVFRTETRVYTDVFRNSNFIKEHGTQERFQKFY